MAPSNLAWLVVKAEMRTDNVAGNTAWPIPHSPTWGSPVPGQFGDILAYNHVSANTPTGSFHPHNNSWLSAVNPSAMRPNGTRYQLHLTYWMYVFNGFEFQRIPVICSDLKERYLAYRFNQSQNMLIPPRRDFTSTLAPLNGRDHRRMRLGEPVTLSAAEVAALPAEIRASIRDR